jgi:hypothetical protein
VPVRLVALVAFFAVACGAATTNTALVQSLKLVYHNGDVYTYSYHATANEKINGDPIAFEITARQTYTVISVDSEGTAELTLALTDLVINTTVNNVTKPMSTSPNPVIDVRAAPDGRILRFYGSSQAPEVAWAVLPDRSVKPGDTWSKDYDSTTEGIGATHLRTKSTYLRVESFGGSSASVVKTTSDATSDITGSPLGPNAIGGPRSVSIKSTGNSEVTSWIDLRTHRLLKTHMTSTTDSIMTPEPTGSTLNGTSGPLAITASITVDLIPA